MSYYGYPLYPLTPVNQQAISPIVGNTTLGVGAATYGKQFMITGAGGYAITLPAIDGVNFPSQSFSIYNSSSSLCNVSTNGSDTMLFLGSTYSSIAILPGERFLVQNMVTGWVVALESASRTTTAPQFDSSIRTASTAFVKASGLQASTFTTLTTTTTLTAANAGSTIYLGGSGGYTVNLPLAASVPTGSRIEFLAGPGVSPVTVARQGSDIVYLNANNTSATVSITLGDTWTLESNGTNWYSVAGSTQLGYSNGFASSLSTNGYQKLPSGLIVQWGAISCTTGATAFTGSFPFTFPNAVLGIVGTGGNTGDTITSAVNAGWLSTSVYRMVIAAPDFVHWIAIGN